MRLTHNRSMLKTPTRAESTVAGHFEVIFGIPYFSGVRQLKQSWNPQHLESSGCGTDVSVSPNSRKSESGEHCC